MNWDEFTDFPEVQEHEETQPTETYEEYMAGEIMSGLSLQFEQNIL